MEGRTYQRTDQVVFTGKLKGERSTKEILAELCRLLNADPVKVRSLLKGDGSVIGNSAGRQLAARYAAAISRAGCNRPAPLHPRIQAAAHGP